MIISTVLNQCHLDQRLSSFASSASDNLCSAKLFNVIPFKIIKRKPPKYPPRAYNRDIEGWVELEYQVAADGKAVNIKVIEAEPEKVFDRSAIKALESWRFSPAKISSNGENVLSQASTTKFNFLIDG